MIENLIAKFSGAIQLIIPILFALVTIVFLYSVVQFIIAGGDEDKKKKSKELIVYSIIGMFVALAIWGIVGAIGGILEINTTVNDGRNKIPVL